MLNLLQPASAPERWLRMGKESKAIKLRSCRSCDQVLTTDANGIKEHARMCAIAKRSGLILPGVERPKIEIVKLYD
jgi:hypothetical protein